MIRTLQQRIVALQQEDAKTLGDPEAMLKVYAETTITRLLLEPEVGSGGSSPQADTKRIAGAFGYIRETGRFAVFEAAAVILATGGIGKVFKVTSNSWEYTGDGHALALLAGAKLMNMEFVQFHPTHMVWPLSVRGLLVTESVRGDGGILKNSLGERYMFNYVPEVFRDQYAETEEEADRWYTNQDGRRPPELMPRDEVARANNAEVKAGRGSPHGGVFLDIASRLPAEEILRRLPSMYHQYKELADVDITKEPMEVGPAQHYVMGGVEVDPDTGESCVPGLFAAGEVSGGMHGSNRLGGNSLSDLLVFGRRPASGAPSTWTTWVRSGQPRARARSRSPRPKRWRHLSALSGRTRTRCTPRSRTRCSIWSASSGTRPRSSRRWPSSTSCASAPPLSAPKAARPIIRAGTSRSTCATSADRRVRGPGRAHRARKAGAATPAKTSPG